tara:strand:+ start:309 stop:500 length:192 start_codon:yes stop_codon:yes gene_type:complete
LKSLVSLETSKQFLEKNNNLIKNNSTNKLNKSSGPLRESREYMRNTWENIYLECPVLLPPLNK